jgi:hypothetical protein
LAVQTTPPQAKLLLTNLPVVITGDQEGQFFGLIDGVHVGAIRGRRPNPLSSARDDQSELEWVYTERSHSLAYLDRPPQDRGPCRPLHVPHGRGGLDLRAGVHIPKQELVCAAIALQHS